MTSTTTATFIFGTIEHKIADFYNNKMCDQQSVYLPREKLILDLAVSQKIVREGHKYLICLIQIPFFHVHTVGQPKVYTWNFIYGIRIWSVLFHMHSRLGNVDISIKRRIFSLSISHLIEMFHFFFSYARH